MGMRLTLVWDEANTEWEMECVSTALMWKHPYLHSPHGVSSVWLITHKSCNPVWIPAE